MHRSIDVYVDLCALQVIPGVRVLHDYAGHTPGMGVVEVSVNADGVSNLYVTAGVLLHPVSLAHLTAHSAFDHDPKGIVQYVLYYPFIPLPEPANIRNCRAQTPTGATPPPLPITAAVLSRTRLLPLLTHIASLAGGAQLKTMVLAAHFPFPGLGSVELDPDTGHLRWEAVLASDQRINVLHSPYDTEFRRMARKEGQLLGEEEKEKEKEGLFGTALGLE